jgi:type I restriction enzyme S subunit
MGKPGYKLTALGWVPDNWEVKELGDVSKISSGGTPNRKKPEYWNGDIPWVTTSLIDFNEIENANEFITEEGLRNSSAKLFPKGTLLMALYGQGVTRGKVATLKISATTNQACAAILPKQEYANNTFLFQYFTLKYQDIRNLSNGGSQENLSGELLKSILLALPPLPEQKLISSILSTWDTAITKEEQLIKALQTRHRALMQQLLSGKRRLKGFKGEWTKANYSNLIKQVKRPVLWNDNDLYQLISVRRRSGGIFLREALLGYQIKVKDLRTAESGDFLFSKMQIVHGASALVTEEFSGTKISGSYIAVIAKDPQKLHMQFFNWYSQLPYFYHQTYVSSFGVHIEKMTFDFEAFLSLEMLLPPIEEQIAISKFISASEQQIQVHRRRLTALQQQKKGLMQVLLTGKIRVKIPAI